MHYETVNYERFKENSDLCFIIRQQRLSHAKVIEHSVVPQNIS